MGVHILAQKKKVALDLSSRRQLLLPGKSSAHHLGAPSGYRVQQPAKLILPS